MIENTIVDRLSKPAQEMRTVIYRNREEAGQRLAEPLLRYPLIRESARSKLVVLSIPKGGVIIGDVVARAIGCAHDVIIIKKIRHPQSKESAIGVVVEDGIITINPGVLTLYPMPEYELARMTQQAKAKVARDVLLFRNGRPLNVQNRIVIVVDDGVATGETLTAALTWLQLKKQANSILKIMVAVPVSSESAAVELMWLSDTFICRYIPPEFRAIGQFYEHFDAVTDDMVLPLLRTCQGIRTINAALT